MSHPPRLPARHRPFDRTLRAAGVIAAALLSLSACNGGNAAQAAPLSPAAAALVASAPAVSATHVPPPPALAPGDTTSANLASLDAQLDTTLTNASACTVDTECHSVAVGARSCGGPTGYRAYSDKTVSAASVDALAQHERDLAAQAARESHQVSPCFMLADPGARCQQNKCVTGRSH
jgi:hypothetical protein